MSLFPFHSMKGMYWSSLSSAIGKIIRGTVLSSLEKVTGLGEGKTEFKRICGRHFSVTIAFKSATNLHTYIGSPMFIFLFKLLGYHTLCLMGESIHTWMHIAFYIYVDYMTFLKKSCS